MASARLRSNISDDQPGIFVQNILMNHQHMVLVQQMFMQLRINLGAQRWEILFEVGGKWERVGQQEQRLPVEDDEAEDRVVDP